MSRHWAGCRKVPDLLRISYWRMPENGILRSLRSRGRLRDIQFTTIKRRVRWNLYYMK